MEINSAVLQTNMMAPYILNKLVVFFKVTFVPPLETAALKNTDAQASSLQ